MTDLNEFTPCCDFIKNSVCHARSCSAEKVNFQLVIENSRRFTVDTFSVFFNISCVFAKLLLLFGLLQIDVIISLE